MFLDVPLLFETGGNRDCDRVITVWCPAFLQTARALRREGMTEEKFSFIVKAQWSQLKKCHLSDLALPSSLGLKMMEVPDQINGIFLIVTIVPSQ